MATTKEGQGLTIVFGTAGFNPTHNYRTPTEAKEVLDTIYSLGVTHLDTAQLYGKSESVLGEINASSRFNIDTKSKGGFDAGNALIPETLYENAHRSLERLNVKSVDVFYIHAPDDAFPPKTWLPTIDKLYKEGVFARLGLSNFHPHQVREVYDEAVSQNFVRPTVFQGNYSPVTRHQETELFPLLRELGIAFYAYSPLAGGFLAKTKKSLLEENGVTEGRFASANASGPANMYRDMYLKPSLLDALEEWGKAAEEEGVSKAELAYRWVSYHSPLKREQGDALIIGARNIEQAVQTIEGLKKGALKASVLEKIDKVWEGVKNEAPLDNYNSYTKLRQGEGK